MKYLLTLLLLVIPLSVSFSADVDPVVEVGSILIKGGSGHMARTVSGQINIKRSGDYVNVVRTGYFQWLKNSPEVSGVHIWNIHQLYLIDSKKNGWQGYMSLGLGGNNVILDGDDDIRGGVMVEVGCSLFGKVPFGIGGKVFPINYKGNEEDNSDRVFIYGMLSIPIP